MIIKTFITMVTIKRFFLRVRFHFKNHQFWYSSILASLVASLILIFFLDKTSQSNNRLILLLSLQFIVLTALLISLNRIINFKINPLKRIMNSVFGIQIYENQFTERKEHFAFEKDLICRDFVYKTFPELIKKIKKEHPNTTKINVVIGAGTTVAPIFNYLLEYDYPLKKENIHIYTNNLEGIDYLQKYSVYLDKMLFNENDITLISGFPSIKYRATQGENAIGFFDFLKRGSPGENQIRIGILTSNWILTGKKYNKLRLCARGEDHFKFKKKLIDTCDYIVIISPLGKLLKLDNEIQLNSLLPTEEAKYKTIDFEIDKKILLQTSFRKKNSISLLARHSKNLKDNIGDITNNYSIVKHITHYKPKGNINEVTFTECPHDYIRMDHPKFFPT